VLCIIIPHYIGIHHVTIHFSFYSYSYLLINRSDSALTAWSDLHQHGLSGPCDPSGRDCHTFFQWIRRLTVIPSQGLGAQSSHVVTSIYDSLSTSWLPIVDRLSSRVVVAKTLSEGAHSRPGSSRSIERPVDSVRIEKASCL
jgi:hypothetical protein